MTTPIQASALRIGMFVHLNVGWMSHPFPLSSFKLTSSEQIETIRSLGLTRLTWSPERSDIEEPAVETAPPPVCRRSRPPRKRRSRWMPASSPGWP